MAKKDRGPGPSFNARDMAWSTTPGSRIDKVDSRLTDALERAAVTFARENPGYSVEGFSGKKGRSSGTKNHPAGKAIDVNIVDPQGTRLGNLRNAASFRTYEKYAQHVRQELDKAGLKDIGRWGGYFNQGVSFDQMHFDLDPRNSMAYGSWENGLNPAGMKALPGAMSIGMGTVRGLPVDRAPVPFSRYGLDPNDLAPSNLDYVPDAGIPSLIGGVQRGMPLGPVSMPSSPMSPAGGALMSPTSIAGSALSPLGGGMPAQSPSFGGAMMSPNSLSSLSPSSLASIAAQSAPRGPTYSPVARAPDMAAMPSTASLSPVNVSTPMSPVNPSTPMAPSATSFGPAPGPAPGPTPSSLASAYGQLGSTLAQAGVTLGGMPAPNAPVATPSALPAVNAPVAMPQPAVQPPPVVQPLPPPRVVPQLQVAEYGAFPDTPPAPPQYSPADIYGGQIGMATATDGNTVGRDPFGRTTVTNQYGVTTAMTPDGKQAAYGGMPGPGGGPSSLFGGGPKMSAKAPGILGGLLGAVGGSMLAGPVGGLVGGMLGKSLLGGTMFGGGYASGFPSAPARSTVDYRDMPRIDFGGFGSGRNASEAEANRGGGGVTSGGTGLW